MTIKGRVVIVKTSISQLLYAPSLLYVPEEFTDKVDKAIVDFVWNKKTLKLKIAQ